MKSKPDRRDCRMCKGHGVVDIGEFGIRAYCHHCFGQGFVTKSDEDFIAFVNQPIIHPLTGENCSDPNPRTP